MPVPLLARFAAFWREVYLRLTTTRVVHFTDDTHRRLILMSQRLPVGTWVTKPSEVVGLNPAEIEARLEIHPGHGEFYCTLRVKKRDLRMPGEGPRRRVGRGSGNLRHPMRLAIRSPSQKLVLVRRHALQARRQNLNIRA